MASMGRAGPGRGGYGRGAVRERGTSHLDWLAAVAQQLSRLDVPDPDSPAHPDCADRLRRVRSAHAERHDGAPRRAGLPGRALAGLGAPVMLLLSWVLAVSFAAGPCPAFRRLPRHAGTGGQADSGQAGSPGGAARPRCLLLGCRRRLLPRGGERPGGSRCVRARLAPNTGKREKDLVAQTYMDELSGAGGVSASSPGTGPHDRPRLGPGPPDRQVTAAADHPGQRADGRRRRRCRGIPRDEHGERHRGPWPVALAACLLARDRGELGGRSHGRGAHRARPPRVQRSRRPAAPSASCGISGPSGPGPRTRWLLRAIASGPCPTSSTG